MSDINAVIEIIPAEIGVSVVVNFGGGFDKNNPAHQAAAMMIAHMDQVASPSEAQWDSIVEGAINSDPDQVGP